MACVIFKCKSPNNKEVTIIANILLYLVNVFKIIPRNINSSNIGASMTTLIKTSVYKGYKQDKIEMRGDRAEMSDFPLYLNTVAGGLDCRNQAIGGFSFVVKIYALPVVEIIG